MRTSCLSAPVAVGCIEPLHAAPGHCKTLAPTWKELAAAFADSDSIAIGHVDCTAQKKPCESAEIKGYPTLKVCLVATLATACLPNRRHLRLALSVHQVFHNGAEVSTYKGSRDLASLKAYIEGEAEKLQAETTE